MEAMDFSKPEDLCIDFSASTIFWRIWLFSTVARYPPKERHCWFQFSASL